METGLSWLATKSLLAAPADGKSVVRFAVRLYRVNAGRQRRDLLCVGITQLPHLLAGKRGNGDADILDILFTFLRGDDDLFQHLGVYRPGNGENHQDEYASFYHLIPPRTRVEGEIAVSECICTANSRTNVLIGQ